MRRSRSFWAQLQLDEFHSKKRETHALALVRDRGLYKMGIRRQEHPQIYRRLFLSKRRGMTPRLTREGGENAGHGRCDRGFLAALHWSEQPELAP